MARHQELRLQSLLKADVVSQLERRILERSEAKTCSADLPEAAQSALAAILDEGGAAPLTEIQARFGELRKATPGAIDSKQPWSDGLATPLDHLHICGLLFQITPARGAAALAVVPMEVLDRLRPADIARPRIFRPCAPPPAPAGPAPYLCQDLMLLVSSILNAPPTRFAGPGLARRDLLRLNAHLLAPDDISDLRSERAARRCLFLRSLAEPLGLLTRLDARLGPGPALLQWLALPAREQRERAICAFVKHPVRYVMDDLPDVEFVRPPEAEITARARAFLVSLLSEADPGEWQSISSLVQAARSRNNSLLRAPGDNSEARCRQTGRALTLRDWNLVEGAWIEALVAGPFYWLGLLEPGRTRKGDLSSFRVIGAEIDPAAASAAGGSIAGRSDAGTSPGGSKQEDPVRVQDDLVTHVSASANLARWFRLEGISELLERGPISRYRIARERVRQALQAGASLEQILEDLGAGAPPAAVATIQGWSNRFGQVRIFHSAVMTAADPALMAELRTAAGVSACLGVSLGARAQAILPGKEEELEAQLRARGEMPHVEPLNPQTSVNPSAWNEIHHALSLWKRCARKEGKAGPSEDVFRLAARLAGADSPPAFPDVPSGRLTDTPADSVQAKMGLVEDAIRQKQSMTFDYDDPDGKLSGPLIVSPRRLGQQGGATCLQGYRKGGARLEWFRLDRMDRLRMAHGRARKRAEEYDK